MAAVSADFALSLLKAGSSAEESFVLSPFSLGSALALVHDGATGETKEELTRLLAKEGVAEDVTTHYSSLTEQLSQSEQVTTAVANKLFVDHDFELKQKYQAHVQSAYNAEVEKLNLKNGSAAAMKVNGFVEKKTQGMIKKLVDASSFEDTVAVLVNAVYFKGDWETEFDKERTKDETFHGVKGDRQVPFMYGNKINGQAMFTDDLKACALPYKDGMYTLLILMPTGDFATWRNQLDGEKLRVALGEMSKCTLNVELPKFKIESDLDGCTTLAKLGVKRLFDAAQLSEISDDPRLTVSKVLHKAVIDVSEEGTEAAAATSVMFTVKACRIPSISLHFRAELPFLYAIVHGRQNFLFVGQHV